MHDRGQVERGERATARCHDPHGGQLLTGPVHVDAQLLENGRAVGPNRDGAATWKHIRPPFEDGDIVSVPQQSPSDGDAAYTCADNQRPQRRP